MTLPPHRYTHAFSQQTRGVQSSTSPFLNWYNKLADSAARYWCISLLQPSQIISIFKMTRSPWRPAVTFYVYQRGGPLVDSSWNLFFFLFWKSNKLRKQPQHGRGKIERDDLPGGDAGRTLKWQGNPKSHPTDTSANWEWPSHKLLVSKAHQRIFPGQATNHSPSK